MVTPSLLIIVMIARFIHHFNEHPAVQHVLAGLRPAALGMIAAAGWFVFGESVIPFDQFPAGNWFDWRSIALFALITAVYWR